MLTKSLCRCCGMPFMSLAQSCCSGCLTDEWANDEALCVLVALPEPVKPVLDNPDQDEN